MSSTTLAAPLRAALPFAASLLLALGLAARPLAAQASAAPAPPASSAPSTHPCADPPARWMQRAVDAWALVSRDALWLPADSLPWVVLFDARCAYHLAPRGPAPPGAVDVTAAAGLRFGSAPVPVHALAHGDTVRLPSGASVPAQPVANASLYRGDSASFFVMALPSLWSRSAEEASDPARDEFFLGVLAHEMTHTVHLAAVARQIGVIGRRWPLPAQLDDDMVQTTFDTVPAVRASVARERALWHRAAVAPSDGARRRLAREALALAERRRRTAFVGARAVYAPLEDAFLLMEGVASWAASRVALAHAPPGTSAAATLHRLEPGRYWSQDLGLAMVLVLDALRPDWKARVFAAEPPSLYALLAEAAGRRRP